MADDEQKTEHINLKVAGQDGSVVQFKVKKVSQLTIRNGIKRTCLAYAATKIDASVL